MGVPGTIPAAANLPHVDIVIIIVVVIVVVIIVIVVIVVVVVQGLAAVVLLTLPLLAACQICGPSRRNPLQILLQLPVRVIERDRVLVEVVGLLLNLAVILFLDLAVHSYYVTSF